MKVKDKKTINYLQTKFASLSQPIYNVEIELEDGYEFGKIKAFGKSGFGIRRKDSGS